MPKLDSYSVDKVGADAISPPTFVEVVEEKEHPDLSLTIPKIHLPQTTLRDALISAIPFPVNLRPDSGVNMNQVLSLRVVDKTTTKQFLAHLSELSGYQLRYLPRQKVIKISSRIQKTWHLPALVGRYQTAVSLGEGSASNASSDDPTLGGTDSSRAEEMNIQAQYQSGQQTEWKAVVQQAHCLIATRHCQNAELEQDGSALFTYPEQGLITAISTPRKIRILDEWLGGLERNLNRFVRLQVALVNIRKSYTDRSGIDFRAMFSANEDNFNINYANNSPTAAVKQIVIGGVLRSGNFSLEGILNLIKEKTDSEVVHKANIIVASGETAVINATEQFYFASGSEIIPGDSQNNQVVSTSLQEESVGIKLAVTPRFLKPGSELLSVRVSPSISRLIGFDPIQSNGRIISQTPRVSSNHFISHSVLRNGNAVIIGGLSSQDSNSSKRQPFGKSLTSLLQDRSKEFTDSELAIIIAVQEVEV